MEWWTAPLHDSGIPLPHHSNTPLLRACRHGCLPCDGDAIRGRVARRQSSGAAGGGRGGTAASRTTGGTAQPVSRRQRNRAPERPRGARAGAGHAGAVRAACSRRKKLHAESGGAFDITVAPLVRCWGFMGGDGRMPGPEEVAEARARVGMGLVQLRPEDFTVRFAREGVMLDLGAIGKGYAVERAARSAARGGCHQRAAAWRHQHSAGDRTAAGRGVLEDRDRDALHLHRTRHQRCWPPCRSKTRPCPSLACWGNSFQVGGRTFGHIIDPRTGEPALGTVLAAVVLPSATETDALSTALLTLGSAGHERIASLRPGMRTVVVSECGGQLSVEAKGIEVRSGG